MSRLRYLALIIATAVVALWARPNAAAPLSCDSMLQSFVTPGMTVATTSKYAIEKIDPGQPLPEETVLELTLSKSLDAVTQSARVLTDGPSANAAKIQPQEGGTTWEITGDLVCVDEGAYGGAIVVYAPVASTENENLTGFLPEGIHWKNATPEQFLPGDINMLSAGNSIVIRRLSYYLLEPAKLNPNIPKPDFGFAANVPEPACERGAATFLASGDDAKSIWHTNADPMTADDFQLLQNIGNRHAVLFGQPVFASAGLNTYNFAAQYLGQVETLQKESAAPLIAPGAALEIIGGPHCVSVDSVNTFFADGYDPNISWADLIGDAFGGSLDFSMYRIVLAHDVTTFWQVRATVQNTVVEGWVIESLASKHTVYIPDSNVNLWNDTYTGVNLEAIQSMEVESTHDASYYWLSPLTFGETNAAYVANWELNRDIAVGEPSTRYAPGDPFNLDLPIAGGDVTCPALPTRLIPFGGARVIVEALNMRYGAHLNAPISGAMGFGSLFRPHNTICNEGYRWWWSSVQHAAEGWYYIGWVAEADANNYFVEPAVFEGEGRLVPRPTAEPTVAPTATPLPFVAQPTNPPAATARPTKAPTVTPTPTDPIPG